MMTRKHFEEAAHILDANHAEYGIVHDFANWFASENPRFDRARFIAASTKEIREDANRLARMLDRDTERV